MFELKPKKKNSGFTVAEILIATIIALLTLTIVVSIFSLNQRVLRKSNTKAELTQNIRIAIDLMAREIRQAKELVTVLPPDNSNPALVAHELKFEDGHTESQIQYIRYYLNNNLLKRQIIVYYFQSDPNTYVYWDSSDPFGPPAESVLQEHTLGEFFTAIDFYGEEEINIELTLEKNNEQVKMRTKIYPRNI